MKILLTADPIGGVWNYALELCDALRSAHATVALATLGRTLSPTQCAQTAKRDNVTLYESPFRLEWMPDPWDDLSRAADWLLDLEQELRPDVVHLNHLVHADLPWRAPVLSVGHSCVLSWWAAVRGDLVPADWSTYRQRVTSSLRAAQCVVAPTQAMLMELEHYYGPFRDTAVIHNARSPLRYMTRRQKERLVLSAGRLWDEAKNMAAVVAVGRDVAARVVIAGEPVGPHGNGVPSEGVELAGFLDADELARWYAKAAIFVLPAYYEPFGLAPLEAALSGCALVLGDIDSLREVWGAAACYVAPDDHEGLRTRLNHLLADDVLRERMAGLALARARQFSPERLAHQYLGLYKYIQSDLRSSLVV